MSESLRDLLRQGADTVERPQVDVQALVAHTERRLARRRAAVGAATCAAVVVLGVTAVLVGQGRPGSESPGPVERPGLVVGAGPVWWDVNGLHHGDVVEQTPVEIGVLGDNSDRLNGALALVRSGAMYLDPATGDVWFHPWGGEPRIVGHDSEAGPGGDPNGDTAAWFEGSDAESAGPGELVVYDTATGREISRTSQSHGVGYAWGEHAPPGNTFRQVTAERVVWTSGTKTYSHDVRTQRTSLVKPPKELLLGDVQDQVEIFGERDSLSLVVNVPGRAEQHYPDMEWHARLSPSGNYVLTAEYTDERHGAAILDTRTGELWRVPKDVYPWIAWSYGDIAMVDHTEDELLACDAARSTCEPLPAEDPFLMPTN